MIDNPNNDTCIACEAECMKKIYTKEEEILINSNKSKMCYSPGGLILKQGTYVSQVVYLKSGIVKILLEGSNERNTILKLVDNNSFIALSILGEPHKYPFSVVAVTECTVCFIRNDILLQIMEHNIEANKYLLKWYANDYKYIYNKILTISTRNSHGKLASALLNLTNGNYKTDILNTISRKELAELASISVESLNKILLQLKRERIIDIDKSGITINRYDLLEKLSTVG